MAKVWGPLHSDDARGKLAKALVFMGWKGIKTVRTWLKPTNPKREKQGNIRTIIGGIGRAVGKVVKDSAFHDQLITLDLIPDQQSKQSYLVQYVKDNYIGGKGATMTAAYIAMLAEMNGHTSVALWTAAGATMGITAFGLDYDTIDDFDKGLGLYLLAKAAIALEFTLTPYTKTLGSWTATQINAMLADMTGAGA